MRNRHWLGFTVLLSLQLVVIGPATARGGGGGGARGGGGGHFTSPVHHGGYAIGTQGAGQYANSRAGGGYGGRGRGHYPWWNGGYGYGYGLGYGGVGDYDDDYGPAYPSVGYEDDAPTPTSPDLHQSGPSMSFQSDVPDQTSSFPAFDHDFDQIASGSYVPAPQMANVYNGNFQAPVVQRKFPKLRTVATSAQPQASLSAEADLQSKFASVQSVFNEYKSTGRLGTFDVQDLGNRLSDIQKRIALTKNPSDPGAASDQEGQILNDLNVLEYDIRQHGQSE